METLKKNAFKKKKKKLQASQVSPGNFPVQLELSASFPIDGTAQEPGIRVAVPRPPFNEESVSGAVGRRRVEKTKNKEKKRAEHRDVVVVVVVVLFLLACVFGVFYCCLFFQWCFYVGV